MLKLSLAGFGAVMLLGARAHEHCLDLVPVYELRSSHRLLDQLLYSRIGLLFSANV